METHTLTPDEAVEMEKVEEIVTKVFIQLLSSRTWSAGENMESLYSIYSNTVTEKTYPLSIMPVNTKTVGGLVSILWVGIEIPDNIKHITADELLSFQFELYIGRLELRVENSANIAVLTSDIVVTKDSAPETIKEQIERTAEILIAEAINLGDIITEAKSRGRKGNIGLALTPPAGNA